MDENYNNDELEKLIIKDKEYFRKRRIKCLLIWIPILLVIAVTITLIFVLKPKPINKLTCYYKTLKEDENILLINKNDDIKYNLIIDDYSFDKKNYHNFNKIGIHKVIFEIKNKLDSLEGLFEGCKNLIEADFSMLQTDNIISMENLFKSCSNL